MRFSSSRVDERLPNDDVVDAMLVLTQRVLGECGEARAVVRGGKPEAVVEL